MLYLLCLFTYAFSLAMFLPLFFPSLYLLFFAPFLVLSFYRYPLSSCLWQALICGFIIDLLSSQTRLGTYAVNYCLATLCLYRYQFHFFEDRLSTLPLMTFCFTCLTTVIQAGLFYMTDKLFFVSWDWLKNDLFLSPFQNALYASCAFSLPIVILSHMRKRYSVFRMIRRRKT